MIDNDGYVYVMSRSDDIINVAAHRFSTGSIEQAISSHPKIAECCVVGIPDALKGHLPFAFVTLSTVEHPDSAVPDEKLFKEVQSLIREQIGAIAALGGMIQGKGMIPKTRSGKTLRRVLRELVENAVHGEFEKEVQVPPTVEDASVVEVARGRLQSTSRLRVLICTKLLRRRRNCEKARRTTILHWGALRTASLVPGRTSVVTLMSHCT